MRHDKVSRSIAPTPYERVLGAAALVLLAFILTAIARGHADWGRVPPLIWAHLVTITVALSLTPALLWQRRGSRRHRQLGWIWASAMFATALLSLFIRREGAPGGWSPIHILSIITLIGVPQAVWRARTHQVEKHRKGLVTMVTGALILAGLFTFPFHRLLGRWLLG